jgi:hypothetical protein
MILTPPKPRGVWILSAICLGACSGEPKRAPQPGQNQDGGLPNEDDEGDGDGDDDSVPEAREWSVSLNADKVELCPGECTTLRALVPPSDQELKYTWNAGLAGTTEVQVCPGATTKYELTLSEVPIPGAELSSERTSTDQLTISVKSCDPESPVLCEARHRYDYPKDENVLVNKKPWIASVGYHSTLQNTKDDGAVIIATFGHRVDLGAGELVATSGANGLVHKYDKDCKSVWSRALAPSLKTDVLLPMSLAVDKDDNAYVTSLGGPLLDLNPFAPTSTTFATEIVFQKFAADGKELYRTAYPVTGGFVYDSAVDDKGQLVVSGMAHNWTDFGGGPLGGALGGSLTGFSTFLLKLDAQGKFVKNTNDAMYQVAQAGDRIVFMDGGYRGVDFLWTFVGPPPNVELKLAALSTTDLQPVWSRPFDPNDEWMQVMLGYDDGRSFGVTQISDFSEDGNTSTTTWKVRPIAADGTRGKDVEFLKDEFTYTYDDAGVPEISFFGSANVQQGARNAAGEIAYAGFYTGEWDVEQLQTKLPYDAEAYTRMEGTTTYSYPAPFAMKLDAQYKLLWLRAPEWGTRASIVGISVDSKGDAWLHGQGEVADSGDGVTVERDMVITKMRGTP